MASGDALEMSFWQVATRSAVTAADLAKIRMDLRPPILGIAARHEPIELATASANVVGA
jgi:hypothetical protein